MKKSKKEENSAKMTLFEKARTISRSVEDGEKVWKIVKTVVVPAAVIGFAVFAYAVLDVDVTGQGRK